MNTPVTRPSGLEAPTAGGGGGGGGGTMATGLAAATGDATAAGLGLAGTGEAATGDGTVAGDAAGAGADAAALTVGLAAAGLAAAGAGVLGAVVAAAVGLVSGVLGAGVGPGGGPAQAVSTASEIAARAPARVRVLRLQKTIRKAILDRGAEHVRGSAALLDIGAREISTLAGYLLQAVGASAGHHPNVAPSDLVVQPGIGNRESWPGSLRGAG